MELFSIALSEFNKTYPYLTKASMYTIQRLAFPSCATRPYRLYWSFNVPRPGTYATHSDHHKPQHCGPSCPAQQHLLRSEQLFTMHFFNNVDQQF